MLGLAPPEFFSGKTGIPETEMSPLESLVTVRGIGIEFVDVAAVSFAFVVDINSVVPLIVIVPLP